MPGTYISGFYEEPPLPHAEGDYGFPESGQTVVTVTDGPLIRLHVGDSPFDLGYARVRSHERALDLRAGVLERRTDWTAPNDSSVRVTSRQLVSFTERVLAAVSYEVEPLDDGFYAAIQSDLLANQGPARASNDPRDPAPLTRPLQSELTACANCDALSPPTHGAGEPAFAWTTMRTRHGSLRSAASESGRYVTGKALTIAAGWNAKSTTVRITYLHGSTREPSRAVVLPTRAPRRIRPPAR